MTSRKVLYILLLALYACSEKGENPVQTEQEIEYLDINLPEVTGFWRQTSGPPAGQINSLLTYDDDYILAGTARNGLFVSDDYGITWIEFNRDFKSESITSLAVSNNGDIFCSVWNEGVYKYDNLKNIT